MISNECRIEDFFRKVDGRRRLEAIHLAHLEITEAQRRLLSQKDTVGGAKTPNPAKAIYALATCMLYSDL